MSDSAIIPVILSGGSGTRLWPVSRESFPKQLWPLISERTLLQETALRARGDRFAPPIIVCNQEHRFLIAEQLRAAGIDAAAHPAGAGRPQQRPGDRRGRRPGRGRRSRRGAVAAGRRPRDRRHSSAAPSAGRRRRRRRAPAASSPSACARPRRRPATATSRSAPRSTTRRALSRRALHREAGCGEAARLATAGRHLWNSGMFVFTARDPARGVGDPRARRAAAVRRAVARAAAATSTSSVSASRRSPPALDQHRLRRGGAHQPRRGGAGRHRLVGCRQLGRAVGARAQGRSRQRRGGRRAAGGARELLRAQRRHARPRSSAWRTRWSSSPRTPCWRCTATARRT